MTYEPKHPGTILKNGATLIKDSPSAVLAIHLPQSPQPYVIWLKDAVDPDSYHSGKYYQTIATAASAFCHYSKQVSRDARI